MRSLASARQQGGLTFANFLLAAILLIFGAILGMKVIPAYVENREIQHILDTIAHDPDMQDALPVDIRNSWDKRAMINNIDVVNAQDLQIQKTPNGQPVISVKYNVKIALGGNVSLLLEFNNTSAHAP
ncbi:MAG TPA: DUF4845 domain-containing protein [Gallionellaceae bacterium]|nr:DUF4845 domain-containing protein [Gallionellaceae bacterium]